MKWHQALEDYTSYLKIERGLSHNSISSYSRDVKKLISFLEVNDISLSPIKIDKTTIQEFIYQMYRKIMHKKTEA